MFRTGRLILAMAVAALALPAAAGSWPNVPARKKATNVTQPAPAKSAVAREDGFEFVGGETGWQLKSH